MSHRWFLQMQASLPTYTHYLLIDKILITPIFTFTILLKCMISIQQSQVISINVSKLCFCLISSLGCFFWTHKHLRDLEVNTRIDTLVDKKSFSPSQCTVQHLPRAWQRWSKSHWSNHNQVKLTPSWLVEDQVAAPTSDGPYNDDGATGERPSSVILLPFQ